MFSLRESVS